MADSDDCRTDVDVKNAAPVPGFSSQCPRDPVSAEQQSVTVSVISDGQSNSADSPGEVGDGRRTPEPERRDDRCSTSTDHGGDTEVVLDPAALTSMKSQLVTDDRLQASVGVNHDHLPSAAVTQPPLSSPRESSRLDGTSVHVVAPNSTAVGPSGSSSDHEGQSESALSLSDVDVLCSEIGRLVADYLCQHLASIVCAINP